MFKYALIALACTASLSSAAIADDDIAVSARDGLTWTAKVNIADLNLKQNRDKAQLLQRMRKAVHAVCEFDAVCNYRTEIQAFRLASQAIASANGRMASAAPTHVTLSGAH